MIWKTCRLLAKKQTGEDALHNPQYDYEAVKETRVRVTPWTDEQIALEGREVTRNEQRFLIPIPFSMFPECQKAEIDGRVHEITKVIDLSPRYTAIQVRIYKG